MFYLSCEDFKQVQRNVYEDRLNANEWWTYPLQGKGAHCVFSQCLCLQQSDFDVTVHLAVVRPVFTAFHLCKHSVAAALDVKSNVFKDFV